MNAVVSVLVADDQTMIRQGLAAILDLEPDLHVVAQAGDAATAVRLAAQHQPDVVLMDVQLEPTENPATDGIATTAEILRASPRSRVLVLTTFARPGYLTRAMAAGASGFLVKDSPADELIRGVRAVHRGLPVVDARVAVATSTIGQSPLSAQEARVLADAGRGGTSAQIARRLHLAEGTVRNTLSRAMTKLEAPTRADAVRIATERGWLG